MQWACIWWEINTGEGYNMFKKEYGKREFSKLIKTMAYMDVTYVVNGFVYIGEHRKFERMNDEPLTPKRINDFLDFAKQENQPCMAVFVGYDHTLEALKLLDEREVE